MQSIIDQTTHKNLVTWHFLDRQFLDHHSNPNPDPNPDPDPNLNPNPNPIPNPVQELTVQEVTWYQEFLAKTRQVKLSHFHLANPKH